MSDHASAAAHQRIPALTRLGAMVIGFGLVFDLSEHSFDPGTAAGFSAGEHAAHLVVLVGMILVLAGIVADGVRTAGLKARHGRSGRHALR